MAWLGEQGFGIKMSDAEILARALAARISVDEAVQRGIALLRQAGRKAALDKKEREEYGRSMEKWEVAWAWAYKWEERLTLEAVMSVSGPLNILEIVCGPEYRKIVARAASHCDIESVEVGKSPKSYGMAANVPPRYDLGDQWTALRCSLNGFPDGLPEEPLMFCGKSLGMYVPVPVLEAEWDKAQEAFHQAWIAALGK